MAESAAANRRGLIPLRHAQQAGSQQGGSQRPGGRESNFQEAQSFPLAGPGAIPKKPGDANTFFKEAPQ